MRRSLICLALAASIAAAFVATAAAAVPIVSPKADPYHNQVGGMRGTKGFGQVKPSVIFYGGDPTGLVCDIRWQSWGGSVARGSGIGLYVGPDQSVAEGHTAIATVVASDLGRWSQRPAYNRLVWSFPNHGQDRSSSPLCL